MQKKIVQDIVPSHKRTVRSIPARRPEPEPEEEVEEIEEKEQEQEEERRPIRKAPVRRVPPPRTESKGSKRKFRTVLVTFCVVFIAIAIIAVALSLLYSKAVVTITPKTAHFDINGTFTAKKDATAPDLSYKILTATESLTQSVTATDGPLIQTKSKGTVVFYNAQTAAQKIVAGTRLSNADDLIYRTSATITIPAQTGSTPGTVSVAVVADQAGANYNMTMAGSEGLKVAAYKGQSKYTTVYAKLKTDITGGFSGTKKIISPTAQAATVKSIEDTLKDKLLADMRPLVALDSILYPNAYSIAYTVGDPSGKAANAADITIKGTINAATFKKDALIKNIAAKELDKFPSPSYSVNGLDYLNFSIVNTKDFSAQKGTPLIFTLKGPVTITGTFDQSALKTELKSTNLKDSNAIFAHYPGIASAYALITPFWMRSFPNSAEKIEIDIKN